MEGLITIVESIAQILALAFSGGAAWFWWRSSKVTIPRELGVSLIMSSEDPFGDNPVKQWADQISSQNAKAALCAAIAFAAQSIVLLVGILPANGPIN